MFPNISLFPGEMFPNIPKHSSITEENPVSSLLTFLKRRAIRLFFILFRNNQLWDMMEVIREQENADHAGFSFYKRRVKVLGLHMIAHKCPCREAAELK